MEAQRKDIYSLPEGDITILWPNRLDENNMPEISKWLDLVRRKMYRAAYPSSGETKQVEE